MSSNAGLYAPRDARLCKEHYPMPTNLTYIGFFEWCKKMSKTHNQKKCRGCGKYLVWTPKKKRLNQMKQENE